MNEKERIDELRYDAWKKGYERGLAGAGLEKIFRAGEVTRLQILFLDATVDSDGVVTVSAQILPPSGGAYVEEVRIPAKITVESTSRAPNLQFFSTET